MSAFLSNFWTFFTGGGVARSLSVISLNLFFTLLASPTKEMYSMIGMMILQQMHDLTDEQAVEQFCFSIQWHYALNITSPADTAAYVSSKSVWTMRDKLSTEEIYTDIFSTTLQRLTKVFEADLSKQRMDSVHIQSNMRHLGRIGLFVRVIKNFLTNLKRHHRSFYDKLDNDLTSRYLSKSTESLFASVKPSDSSRTLDQLAEDIFILTQQFGSAATIQNMSSLKQLVRLFQEQCMIEEGKQKAVARPNKDVPSDSLQNPSDPDAGYSNHKGKGYQVQVVESYSDKDEKQLSLITYVAVESADKHDANCEKATAEHDIKVIAPAMPGNQKSFQLAEFSLDEQGRIILCPCNKKPERVKRTKKGFSVAFSSTTCQDCESFDCCPVTTGKKACYYRYKTKDIRTASRRWQEESESFKDKYRYRAGVEATMSEYDRRTGVKHLRVRGMKAVRFAAIMKAIGLNVFRAARYRRLKGRPEEPLLDVIWVYVTLYRHVKEQISLQTQLLLSVFVELLQIGAQQRKILD